MSKPATTTPKGTTMNTTPLMLNGPAKVHDTREAWLTAAVEALRPLFHAAGTDVPAVRVSCGWPSKGGTGTRGGKVIGQCWASGATADGVAQVFISPTLADRETVLATLLHELVHAVQDCKTGHGKEFGRLARAVGLTGKMTATHASEELEGYFPVMLAELGEYPHAALTPGTGRAGTGRMLKVSCPRCGIILRASRAVAERIDGGACPCCGDALHWEQ